VKRIVGNLVLLAIAAWVCLFIYGFIHAALESSKNLPGKPEFEAANKQIDVYSKEAAFGNSEKAVAVANEFSDALQGTTSGLFTGGSRLTPATGGHFLTYCRLDDKSVVLLCQVPDLRGYKGKERDMLSTVAWALAQGTVKKMVPGEGLKLAVGLRGFGSYGPVMEGTSEGKETRFSMDDPDAVERLYPYFIVK